MEHMNVKIKKWGNSFGIVLPRRFINQEKLHQGAEISMTFHPKKIVTAGELMAIGKKMNLLHKLKEVNTQKALVAIDEAFWEK